MVRPTQKKWNSEGQVSQRIVVVSWATVVGREQTPQVPTTGGGMKRGFIFICGVALAVALAVAVGEGGRLRFFFELERVGLGGLGLGFVLAIFLGWRVEDLTSISDSDSEDDDWVYLEFIFRQRFVPMLANIGEVVGFGGEDWDWDWEGDGNSKMSRATSFPLDLTGGEDPPPLIPPISVPETSTNDNVCSTG